MAKYFGSTKNVWELLDATTGFTTHTLLSGPSGTGKTLYPWLWAKRHCWHYIGVSMNPESQPSDLIGSFAIQEGNFAWLDGPFARAWRLSHEHNVQEMDEAGNFVDVPINGVILNIDEIDHAGGAAQSTLQTGLNDLDMAKLDLPTGERIRPNPNRLLYFATMNGDPDELPPALRDRFTVTYLVKEPNPQALEGLPEDLRDLALNSMLIDDEQRKVSLRPLFAFERLRNKGVSEQDAAVAIFGARGQDFINARKAAIAAKDFQE